MRRLAVFVVLIFLVVAGCDAFKYHDTLASPASPPSPAGTSAPAQGAPWSASNPWSLPNPKLTPGSTQDGGTYSQVCPHVDPALEAARPGYDQKNAVYQEYGMSYPSQEGEYEMDHLVPIELGGAPDNPANLWPERNAPASPAMEKKWGLDPSYVENPKDILEDALHELVCSGKVGLATAQQAIAVNWVKAYHTYVEGMTP